MGIFYHSKVKFSIVKSICSVTDFFGFILVSYFFGYKAQRFFEENVPVRLKSDLNSGCGAFYS